ncbi:MAG: transcriptional regulator [Rhizobiales bacterium 17-65-6]|nr:MAG: transcriptional regulator [Rhizobiales bacterium 12-68-15]OYY10197.1 MAG: transcriptional regulator [Rhizobiales bacterium 35-68-8]OYZ99604.1 MAG: transcriptional regulator [Rhizobiales bacterium 17-65-6]
MRHEVLPVARHMPSLHGLPLAAPEVLLCGCPELVGTSFSYGREEEIFGEGEDAEFVYKVVHGAVRTCKMLSDGRRQIDAFHLPGDLFGFETAARHRMTAEAVADTTVLLFRRRQIEDTANRDVATARKLWDVTMRTLGHAQEHMILLGRRTALERVAAFLTHMDERLGGSGQVDLAMPRRDIADYLGLTLETVSRALSQLQQDGVLRLDGARKIMLDRSRMAAIVED